MAAMLSMVPAGVGMIRCCPRDVRAALASLSQHGEPWDGPAKCQEGCVFVE